MLTEIKKSEVLYKKMLVIEFVIGLLITSFLVFKFQWILSFSLGYAVAWIAQLSFVFFLFKKEKKLKQTQKIKALYQAESVKIVITIILFAILFLFIKIKLHTLSFFIGYIILIFLNSLLSFLLLKNKN